MFIVQPQSQRDSAWRALPLGNASGLTIGSDGCLLTCLSMVCSGFGHAETPASLNEKLQALGPGRGFQGALYVWAGLQRVHPDLTLRNLVVCRTIPAPIAEIDAALDLGMPVIVELDQSPAPGMQNHWVVLYGRQNGGHLMHDPWPIPLDLERVAVEARYGFAGGIAATITAAAFFQQDAQSGNGPPAHESGVIRALRVMNVTEVIDAGGLALRGAPGGLLVTRLPAGTPLELLDTPIVARDRLGQAGTWLNVRAVGGASGFVAAWLVEIDPAASAGPPVPAGPDPVFVTVIDDSEISAAGGLALRETPGGRIVQRLPAGTILAAQEIAEDCRSLIGKPGRWLRVNTAAGDIGYVAAWLVAIRDTRALDLLRPAVVQLPLRARRKLLHLRVCGDEGTPRARPGAGALLRLKPRNGRVVARLRPGTHVTVIGAARVAMAKVGRRGEWIKVEDDLGRRGHVSGLRVRVSQAPKRRSAASSRELAQGVTEPDIRPTLVVADHPDVRSAGGLAVRAEPRIAGKLLSRAPAGHVLMCRISALEAAALLDQPDAWLPIVTPLGLTGYSSAAYLVRGATGWDSPTSPGIPAIVGQRTVIATLPAPLRAAGHPDAPTVWQITEGTPLRIAEDGDRWQDQVGSPDAYLLVESHAFKRGYVRANQVAWPRSADSRAKVLDPPLPKGVSAWLYGVHDPFDKGLFTGTGKQGWAVFTERVESRAGNPAYAEWADAGYGVIVRLNNDYGGSGTVPAPEQYDVFASQCADWVRASRGGLIWVIGNEMNNPREWPNQPDASPGTNLADEITPENYALCFNKVRAAIRGVQPRAVVIPGALDCFQGPRISCLAWFGRMLDHIDDLDGLALHCYTNGYHPDLIPSLATFDDDPLRWQYYHFRAYATFLDAVPAKWRAKPVFITESDPHGGDPWSGDQNGWVQAAYAEVDRHNQQPHAQQIRALVLYRWSTDDQYTLQRRPGAQRDLRATIATSDYRWRA